VSAYRDADLAPGHAKTTLVFPGVPMPSLFLQIGLAATALGGLGAMMHPSRPAPWWAIGLGLMCIAFSTLGGRSSSMAIDRAAGSLEIRYRGGVRTVRIGSLEEVVTERTRLHVTILLRTKLGEEIPVWSGLAPFAGDVVGPVQSAITEPLEEVKDRD
jgi:hypothetical protein